MPREPKKDCLCTDTHGRVPFAMVAVLLMVLTGISGAYLSLVNIESEERLRQHHEIETMDTAIKTVHEDISGRISESVGEAIANADIFHWDLAEVNTKTQDKVSAYINEQYTPLKTKQYSLTVLDHNVYVLPQMMRSKDFIPMSLNNEGKNQLSVAGTFGDTEQFSYLEVVGQITYEAYHFATKTRLNKTIEFKKDVMNPLPLLKAKIDGFKFAASGNGCEIALLTQFMVQTLAQFRVLMGKGNKIDFPDKTNNPIIEEKDVTLALNIAIMLFTARMFRTTDPDVPAAIDGNNEYIATDPTRALKNLMNEYANRGTIDPSDILALYMGLDKEFAEQDYSIIISQMIYSIVDCFLIRFLDYFGFVSIIDTYIDYYNKIKNIVTDIVTPIKKKVDDFITSLWDTLNGNNQKTDANTAKYANARNYITKTLENAKTIEPYSAYAKNFDLNLLDPPSEGWPSATFDLGPYSTKLYSVYNINTDSDPIFNETGAVVGHTYYTNWTERTISTTTSLHFNDRIEFTPVDMCGAETKKSDVWVKFFDENLKELYSNSEDETDNVVSLREGVKKAATRISEELTAHAKTILTSEMKKLDIKPYDNLDFLEVLKEKMSRVIKELVDYYSEGDGKNKLAEVIKSIFFSDDSIDLAPILNALVETINKNYLVLVGLDSKASYASESSDQRVKIAYDIAREHTSDLTVETPSIVDPGTAQSRSRDSTSGYPSAPSGDIGDLNNDEAARFAIQNLLHYHENAQRGYAYWSTSAHLEDVAIAIGPYVDSALITHMNKEAGMSGAVATGTVVAPIQALEKTANGDDGLLSKFVDFFVNGAADLLQKTGLISIFGDLSESMMQDILSSEKATNARLFEPMAYGEALELWYPEDDYESARRNGTVSLERFVVDQEPRYLQDETDNLKVKEIPESAQQFHFTEMGRAVTQHPYESKWSYCVAGKFDLNVRTDKRYPMPGGGSDYIWYKQTVNIRFDLPVIVYSGWELNVAETTNTANFLSDVWSGLKSAWDTATKAVADALQAAWNFFMEQVLPFIKPIIDPIVDLVQQIVKFISDIASKVLQYATKIVEFVKKAIATAVDAISKILKDYIKDIFNKLQQQLPRSPESNQLIKTDIFGFSLLISLTGVDGVDIKKYGIVVEMENRKIFPGSVSITLNPPPNLDPSEYPVVTINIRIDWETILTANINVRPMFILDAKNWEGEAREGDYFINGEGTILNRVKFTVDSPGEERGSFDAGGYARVSINLKALLHLIPVVGTAVKKVLDVLGVLDIAKVEIFFEFGVELSLDKEEVKKLEDDLKALNEQTLNPIELFKAFFQKVYDFLTGILKKISLAFHFIVGICGRLANGEGSLSTDMSLTFDSIDSALALASKMMQDKVFVITLLVGTLLTAIAQSVLGPVGSLLVGSVVMGLGTWAVSRIPDIREIAQEIWIGISVSSALSQDSSDGIFQKSEEEFTTYSIDVQLIAILEAMGVRARETIDSDPVRTQDPCGGDVSLPPKKLVEVADWGVWNAVIALTVGKSTSYNAEMSITIEDVTVSAGLYGAEVDTQERFRIHLQEIEKPPFEYDPTIIQISDVHIDSEEGKQDLQMLLNRILTLEKKPRYIVISGDISSAGAKDSGVADYMAFKNAMKQLEAEGIGIVIRTLPGNHDYRSEFWLPCHKSEDVSKGLDHYKAEMGGYDLSGQTIIDKDFIVVGLDSGNDYWKSGFFGGSGIMAGERYDDSRGLSPTNVPAPTKNTVWWMRYVFDGLDGRLDGKCTGTQKKIIVMHHPAYDGIFSIQTIGENRDLFMKMCDDFDVDVVLAGHTHTNIEYTIDGTKYIQTSETPAYRSIAVFEEDGKVRIEVSDALY